MLGGRPVGQEAELAAVSEGCGMWIPAEVTTSLLVRTDVAAHHEYLTVAHPLVQFRMCLKDEAALPGGPKMSAVYSRDGKFYGQELENPNLELSNGCRQMAFFHFQEWKKLWEQQQNSVPPLAKSETLLPPPFLVSTEGITLLREPR